MKRKRRGRRRKSRMSMMVKVKSEELKRGREKDVEDLMVIISVD
jgi:hypothetical protein